MSASRQASQSTHFKNHSSCNQLKMNGLLRSRNQGNSQSLDQSEGPGAPGFLPLLSQYLATDCQASTPPGGFSPAVQVEGSQATAQATGHHSFPTAKTADS
jgi:hypothetical protein